MFHFVIEKTGVSRTVNVVSGNIVHLPLNIQRRSQKYTPLQAFSKLSNFGTNLLCMGESVYSLLNETFERRNHDCAQMK